MSISNEIIAAINNAEIQAAKGCGLSDVLYESRVQDAYKSILENTPVSEREAVEIELKERGFDPDFKEFEAKEGQCSLTGIEEDCCPCGRHP